MFRSEQSGNGVQPPAELVSSTPAEIVNAHASTTIEGPASRVGMWYSTGTLDHPQSYSRYTVIADDDQGMCTVRNLGGGCEYPVASYLIDQMAEPAEAQITAEPDENTRA